MGHNCLPCLIEKYVKKGFCISNVITYVLSLIQSIEALLFAKQSVYVNGGCHGFCATFSLFLLL